MIRKTFLILLLLLLLLPSFSFAASIRVGALYFPQSDSQTVLITNRAVTSFDSAIAPEIAVGASLFGNVEGELSASWIRSDAQFEFREVAGTLGQAGIMPISASLFYARPASLASVYVGGGVTHVMFREFEEEESGIRGLELADDTTWHAAGGVRIPFNRFAFDIGALYLPIESTFSARSRDPLDIEIEPLMFRAGVRYSF